MPIPTTSIESRPVSSIPIQARVEIARHKPALRGQPEPLAALMAERLVDHEIDHGAGTETDILRDGFTTAELIEHGPEAKALAARLSADRAARGDLARAA